MFSPKVQHRCYSPKGAQCLDSLVCSRNRGPSSCSHKKLGSVNHNASRLVLPLRLMARACVISSPLGRKDIWFSYSTFQRKSCHSRVIRTISRAGSGCRAVSSLLVISLNRA